MVLARAAWFLVVALAGGSTAGCRLGPLRNGCTTTADCFSGSECVDMQCVRTVTTPPPSMCDLSMPFGAPVLVYGLNRNPGDEYRINVSPDELTAYVASGAAWNTSILFVSTRASRTDPFAPLVPLTSLNAGMEVSVSVTADGLTIFFDRTTMNGQIFAATRTALDQPFGMPGHVVLNPGTPEEFDAYVLPDGSALYFTAVLEQGGMTGQIYRAAMRGTRADPPVPVQTIPGARFPVVSADELTLYFAAPSAPAETQLIIFVTTRTSRDDPFDPPAKITELMTSAFDAPQWISPDGCRLYFTRSNGFQVAGASYSFVAERTPPAATSGP
jgi:hypothetical protein